MQTLERDFINSIKSAISEATKIAASWKPEGVCFQITVCSSYAAETIKLRIRQETITRYLTLNRRSQFFARRRLTDYFARRFNEYTSDRGYYSLRTKLVDPEWTVSGSVIIGELPRAQKDDHASRCSPRFALFGDSEPALAADNRRPDVSPRHTHS